ncbi:zinc-finger protein [Metarhizium rileyi]|uniref:C2H2 type master regulator of conidiophore development brlA n=1 Tax=Metarhizium rileyi (strain RCEF 4871) TaxID=1649241 RepID=A0A5C6GIR4_METRR|nr:zinc-finger protein [Metarhizium rileyi]
MMDGSHMTFDGLMGSANHPSNDDLPNLHIDFDTLLSSEHALNLGLGPYEQCVHDDSCLHFTQSTKTQDKTQAHFAQTPPATSSLTRPRNRPKSNRPLHGRAKSQIDFPSNSNHSQDYSWDNIFNDNALNAYAMATPNLLSPVVEAKSQVMAQEDQFMCRWLVGHNGTLCGLRFENDEQLQKHCKNDHLKQLKKINGGFRCGWAKCTRDTCFTQRSKVERHMQVHTGYKPVQCTICGAALSAKQALDQHMRIHTGETPWVCKYPGCGCAFKQQSALTMHERTHTGDKPLECEICGKRFSESSNLSKHRRTHNVKGMHECQLCGKDFHRLDQLRRHMGTNHKDRPAEVDAILNEAKSKIKAHKVSKLKKVRVKGRDAKSKPKLPLDLDNEDEHMNMIGESIQAVAIQQ